MVRITYGQDIETAFTAADIHDSLAWDDDGLIGTDEFAG